MYNFLSKLTLSTEIMSVLFKPLFTATRPQSGTSQVLHNTVSVTKMQHCPVTKIKTSF